MRNRHRPSTVHVHARVCTYRALMDGRGRMDAHRYTSPTVTSERTTAMTAHHPQLPKPHQPPAHRSGDDDSALLARLHIRAVRRRRPGVLAALPAGSADCIVTSPPYWAKRDYGVRGQYGHEPDPAAYVETLRGVFREAWRVLADDGTCWLNLGDSYSAGGAPPAACTPISARPSRAARPGHGRQEPARPALAGRARPPGRRMDRPQRHRVAQAERHARVRTRPAELPVRTRVPAREVPPLLVRPRPHPRAARHGPPGQRRHRAAPGGSGGTRHAGNRAARRRRRRARAGQASCHRGPGTPPGRHPPAEVRAAYPGGHRRPALRHWPQPPGPPQWPQPRRRVAHPDPPLPWPALRRVPDRPAHPVHQGGLQARRHGARPILRHRHHRPGRTRPRPALHRHRTQPAFAALAAERLRHAAMRHADGTDGERQ